MNSFWTRLRTIYYQNSKLLPKNDFFSIFIGPESDHWQSLSLTDFVTDSSFVDLIDVTLSCEDANSKLVDVVTVANLDDENRVKLLFRL